ncbi:hypothetical protein A6770_22555 [Nostoc minutum NIES-26]|uniref:Uncharacterized protein n=1 Tax=Nostoc minutum NIES-26 TaxID=1844469 RepID=A0A367QYE3_9NOSO|nr:hypothetical protein A6770_22555 [Nostoc minutum NIES-26]
MSDRLLILVFSASENRFCFLKPKFAYSFWCFPQTKTGFAYSFWCFPQAKTGFAFSNPSLLTHFGIFRK